MRDARPHLAMLTLLVAAAVVLHELWWHGPRLASPHVLVVAAAAWAAVRPASVGRLAALSALEAAVVAWELPAAGSHTLLLAVCCAGLAGHVGWRLALDRRLPDAGALLGAAGPLLRGAAVVLYAAAALAKLNEGFFDAAASCAAALAPRIAWFDPSLLDGAWLAGPAIWGTVLVEAALAALLLVPRTRRAGVVLGCGFHAVLALAGNVPFTAVVLVLYVAFLPAAPARRAPALPARALPLLAAAWAAGALADPEAVRAVLGTATRLVAVVLCVVVARSALRPGPRWPVVRARPFAVAGVGLLVLNAASPYLGLKTESSFAMYSNLQTEGGTWNHLLLPEAVQVFGHQDELVAVQRGAAELRRRTAGGKRMVRWEVERWLRRHPGATATVDGADARVPATVLTPVLDRVAKFRDVRPAAQRGC